MPDYPPEPLYTFRGSMKSVHCILPKINDQNELLYVGTNTGQVHVWDLKLKREIIKHEVGSEPCLCILFSNDTFFTQQKGDSIKFWNENTDGVWNLQKILKHDYTGFCKMDLFKHFIYLPNNDSVMVMYDFINNKEKTQVKENCLGEIMCLKVISSMECIFVCYESGEIILWNMQWVLLYQIKGTVDCPMALDYCEASKEGIFGTNNNKIVKFMINEDNKAISVLGEATITNPGVSSITINKEGKLCVIGCWDSRIRYYSMKKLTLLAVLTHHTDSVDSIAFINEDLSFYGSGVLVAGGKDTKISLWNLYTKSQEKFVKNKKL